jgi:tRNA threonylcarbamoyladenosine biosynthesis protein TsaB
MLLAIDTATRAISLALHDGQSLRAEATWPSDNQHTIQLAPSIADLLNRAGVTTGMLSAFAVSEGPGSFTGLRIGVALAKGMASARRAPLIGVSTLDVAAAGHPFGGDETGDLIAVVQAGRGRVVARPYTWQEGCWQGKAAPVLLNWTALIQSLETRTTITGEIDPNGYDLLIAAQGEDRPVTIAPASYRLRRAGVLAQIAWDRLQASDDAAAQYDPAILAPVYLRSEGL